MLQHWPQEVQIGLPNLIDILYFSALRPIQQGHNLQHLLVTWGRLKSFFFSISALIPNVKKPLVLISIFAQIGMVEFGLKIGPDS